MNTAEVLELLGIGRTKLYELIHAGKLHPSRALGPRSWRFSKSEVTRLMETPTDLSPVPVPTKLEALVYAMQYEGGGPIKIGTSRSVGERLASLQTASPWRVVLVGFWPGDVREEKKAHDHLHKYRMRSEFQNAPPVRAYVLEHHTP